MNSWVVDTQDEHRSTLWAVTVSGRCDGLNGRWCFWGNIMTIFQKEFPRTLSCSWGNAHIYDHIYQKTNIFLQPLISHFMVICDSGFCVSVWDDVTLTLHLSVHPHKFISFLFWFVHFFKTQGENISNYFGRGLKVTTTSVSSASPELIPVAGRHLVVLEDF